MPKITLNDKSVRRGAPDRGQIELWDKILPGFGLRVAAGGARTYFVMRRIDGKLVRRTVGKHPPMTATKTDAIEPDEFWVADAREAARHMLLEMARGIDPTPPRPKRAVIALRPANDVAAPPSALSTASKPLDPRSFGGVAASYFKDESKRGGGALRSKAELERKVRVDLAAWRDRPIHRISRAEVKALIKAKHEVSPVAANRLLALVHRIFRWAVREDLIEANPAADLDPPGQETERDRVLSLDELKRIWDAAEKMGYPYGRIVQLLILTAQRRGEVAGMVRQELVTQPAAAWRLPDARAKRRKGHLIPLSPRARALIDELPVISGSPLLFTTGRRAAPKGQKVDPDAPPAPVSGWTRLKDRLDWLIALPVAKAAGEPDLGTAEAPITDARKQEVIKKYGLQEWILHDLRRAVATHLRDEAIMGEARVERLTVSKVLNHAESGMTKVYDRYSNDSEKRRALDTWALAVERFCGLNVIDLDQQRATGS